MLTKESVVGYIEEYYSLQGYAVYNLNNSSNLVLKKDENIIMVIAMGTVSSLGNTNTKGKEFNKNQIRTNIGLALFEISKQITNHKELDVNYVIAMPDSRLYEKQYNSIKEGLKAFDVEVLFTSEMGLIKEI